MRTFFRLVFLVALVLGVFWLIQHREGREAAHEVKAEGKKAVNEARKAIADLDVKAIGEEHKQSIRHERRDSLALLKELEGSVEEDEIRRAQKAIQDLTDAHCAKIDEHEARKEKEILTV